MKKLLVGLLFLLAACTATNDKPVGKITVSNATWGSFQQYLAAIGINQPGAFAISKTGHGSYYIWCRELQCAGGPTYKYEALRACERDGADCVIFAFGRDILVSYDVEKPTTTSSTNAAPAPSQAASIPPPRLRVSKALRSKIEIYLANSKTRTEYYRFLAINDAGDRLGLSTGCKIRKSGWGGWTAEGCGNEAQAKQLAIDTCGSDCRVIYKDDQQLGKFEIDWY